jgi:hypothetical protein
VGKAGGAGGLLGAESGFPGRRLRGLK